MMSLSRQLERLERQQGGRCPVCRDWPDPYVALAADDGDIAPPVCPGCGWQATQAIVKVYIGVDLDAV